MTLNPEKESRSRREFLKAAALTAAAATATGAGATLLRGKSVDSPSVSPQSAASLALGPTGAAAADVLAQLAAAQADNVRLRATIDALERRLSTSDLGDSKSEALNLELEQATAQASLLSGLVALYEQLDAIDPAEVLEQGIEVVSASIAELVDEIPTLSEGIEAGRQALQNLDDHIPLLESGRRWLDERSNALALHFGEIERSVSTAVDSAAPLLEMFGEWIEEVLRWLPFGIGQRAANILRGISGLLATTNQTIDGVQPAIAEPLDVLLTGEAGEVPLRENVVKPLRDKVLDKTQATLTKAQQFEEKYRLQLANPARSAAASRQALRALVAEYRMEHDI